MKNVEDIYPLSPMQQGMLFHSLYAPQSGVYVEQLSCVLEGELNVRAFEQAWREVLSRHPILRTAFVWEGLDAPLQVVRQSVRLPLEERNWRGLSEDARRRRLEDFLAEDRRRGFDITEAPLVRLALIRLGGDEYRFVWSFHHLLLDGWSMFLVLKEVFGIYEAASRADDARPARGRPFRDYIAWLQRQDAARAEAFWRAALEGVNAPTPVGILKAAANASRDGDGDGDTYRTRRVELTEELTAALEALGRRHRLTLNTLVQGAWALLLSRYGGVDDVMFGVTHAGRPSELTGVEEMVGLFINTLPLRARVAPEAPLLVWLGELQTRQAAAQQFAFSPLVEVQRWGGAGHAQTLFESLVVFENYPLDAALRQQSVGGLRVSDVRFEERTNYPLTLVAVPDARLCLKVIYDSGRLTDAAAESLAGHLQTLLEGFVADPARSVGALPLLTAAEERETLRAWNDTRVDDAPGACLHQLFEAQAGRTPDAVAAVYEDARLTYAELNGRANQLARLLREKGVGPEALVGVLMERSLELVVALLGILKAGAAYVPLDPSYPRERLEFMLGDAGVRVLLTQPALLDTLPRHETEVVCLDAGWRRIAAQSTENLRGGVGPDNLAYVIYTSGSTGRPKGVLISHGNVSHLLRATEPFFRFGEEDVWTLFHSAAFDFSVWELWGALLYGGRLVVVPYWVSRSPEQFRQLLGRERVTILNQTPSAFRQLIAADAAAGEGGLWLRHVIFGGESLGPQSLRPWFARHGDARPRLVNMYGITETTVHVTHREMTAADVNLAPSSRIGRAIPCLQLYILDPHGRPAPAGVPGEICVGGTGLARGYLNRPGLTAERFVPHPFSGEPGARLYRSGDLARYLPDGDIEYLGRIDKQVKVRGFRIELGEIEAALTSHPRVREAAVAVRGDAQDEQRLVAYYLLADGAAPTAGELRAHLKERLPEYMMPSAFVCLERMPLTPNGKLDRGALPAPERAGEEGYVGPRTPVEEVLCGIFAEVLDAQRVGTDDDFFELGGHSLLATQVVSRAREALGAEVGLRDLFERPTARGLGRRVEEARRAGQWTDAPPVVPVGRTGDGLPLSFAQQRLWFVDQLEPGGTFYNSPVAVRLSGRLNVEALERTLSEVVRRHEVLRTTFDVRDGRPVQVVHGAAPLRLNVVDLSGVDEGEREAEALRLASEEVLRPFDLSRGPLLRVTLHRLGAEEHLVLMVMHHIMTDEWSMGVLVKEVAALYAAHLAGAPSPLPELPVQYADFAAWEQQYLRGEVMERHLAFWRKQLGGTLPVLNLPTDHARPAVQSFRGAIHPFALPESLSESLKRLSRREGCTLYMTLMAAFKVLLSRYTGQDDILVGTPLVNRTRGETEALVGFFVNTLVLRTDTGGNPTFVELLGRVRDVTLGAYEHQDTPFDKLVEEFVPTRAANYTPLFQVVFGVRNAPLEELELPGLKLSLIDLEDLSGGRFDLSLWITERERGLTGKWYFNTDLFEAATVRRIHAHFETLLRSIVAQPETRLRDLEFRTQDEKTQRAHVRREREESNLKMLRSVRRKDAGALPPPEEARDERAAGALPNA